uniref:Vitellogenin-1 n=1 Tax=Lygus hesperus TaxID=30085 RepID=A0A0A9Y0Q3_LYGHE
MISFMLQMALDVEAKMPNVPLANYRKALEADATSQISAVLNFGEKGSSGAQVSLQGKIRQSSERRDYVRSHPMSALCEQQMQQGNNIQQACRNATAAANILDQYRYTIHYERVPESVKNATYKAYAIARYFGNLYVSENIVNPNNKQGQVEIEVNLGKDLKSVNVSMAAPAISASFENVPLNPYVAAVVAAHPEYNVADRVGQYWFQSQQFPTCSIDKNQATTFDNKSYPINLGGSWHVMAFSQPKSHFESDSASSASSSEQQAFSILVRQTGSDKKEIMAILGNDIVEVLPQTEGQKAGIVKFNGKKANFDAQTSDTFQDEDGNTVIQVFALPSGTLRLIGEKHGMEILFDGQRVKLQVSNSYRGQMRGLCGVFDGEPVNDFTSPKNCILRNPFEFAASFAIPDSSLTSPAKELRQKAENADCYRQTVMLGDVISENEAGRSSKQSSSSKSSNQHENRNSKLSSPARLRVMVIRANGQTCFSTRPQLSCQSPSQEANTAQKNVDFHCVSDATAAKRWEEQIKRGASPDFSKKGSNYRASMKLPSRCNA